MGNLESQSVVHASDCSHVYSSSGRLVDTVDFPSWADESHSIYGFTPPCIDYHSNENIPYRNTQCFNVEEKVGRRRSVQFRRDLTRYYAEIERLENTAPSIHIRDQVKNEVSVITLDSVVNNMPELDFMYEPLLTVIAYHCDICVLAIQEKTKNLIKTVIVCDIAKKCEVGYYVVDLNYSNLNSVQIDCCISYDCSTFIFYILEDHYDEFHAHFHAIVFNECRPVELCCEKYGHAMWYEVGLHMTFLPGCSDRLALLGECPLTTTSESSLSRHLAVYSIHNKGVLSCLEVTEQHYPVGLTCSTDCMWIATLSRNHGEQEQSAASSTAMENYVVKLYTVDKLCLMMQVEVLLSNATFSGLSHCNKMVFSNNSCLLAVASNDEHQDTQTFNCWEFEPVSSLPAEEPVLISVFRLPVISTNLKSLCREAILDHCSYHAVKQLPLPIALQDFVMFSDK